MTSQRSCFCFRDVLLIHINMSESVWGVTSMNWNTIRLKVRRFVFSPVTPRTHHAAAEVRGLSAETRTPGTIISHFPSCLPSSRLSGTFQQSVKSHGGFKHVLLHKPFSSSSSATVVLARCPLMAFCWPLWLSQVQIPNFMQSNEVGCLYSNNTTMFQQTSRMLLPWWTVTITCLPHMWQPKQKIAEETGEELWQHMVM